LNTGFYLGTDALDFKAKVPLKLLRDEETEDFISKTVFIV